MEWTKYDLASLCMISHRDMDRFMKVGFPGPVSLLMSLQEFCFAKDKLIDCPPYGDGLFPFNKV